MDKAYVVYKANSFRHENIRVSLSKERAKEFIADLKLGSDEYDFDTNLYIDEVDFESD